MLFIVICYCSCWCQFQIVHVNSFTQTFKIFFQNIIVVAKKLFIILFYYFICYQDRTTVKKLFLNSFRISSFGCLAITNDWIVVPQSITLQSYHHEGVRLRTINYRSNQTKVFVANPDIFLDTAAPYKRYHLI